MCLCSSLARSHLISGLSAWREASGAGNLEWLPRPKPHRPGGRNPGRHLGTLGPFSRFHAAGGLGPPNNHQRGGFFSCAVALDGLLTGGDRSTGTSRRVRSGERGEMASALDGPSAWGEFGQSKRPLDQAPDQTLVLADAVLFFLALGGGRHADWRRPGDQLR
jgi:hypothetical protein